MAKTYTTISGDTWDIISYKAYGSEKFIDLLIGENYQHRFTCFFSAGVQLVIPDVDIKEQNSRDLPPWKRGNQ